MDKTAWILNLREPFGAALARELVAKGWKVLGGDSGVKDDERASSDLSVESDFQIGENRLVPTGSGTTGLIEFEGSVAYGPESNQRRTEPEPATRLQVAEEDRDLPHHGRLIPIPLDGSDPQALEQAKRHTAEQIANIDLLVLNAGKFVPDSSGAGLEDDSLRDAAENRLQEYERYALTPLRVAEQMLPLLDAGSGLKRIAFVTSSEGSLSAGEAPADAKIGGAMAHAALHMQAKLLFNDLRRSGYTFRLYDPGLLPQASSAGTSGLPPTSINKLPGEPMASLASELADSARFAAGLFTNPSDDEDQLTLIVNPKRRRL
ncbi:hypothetical protein [Saccharibacillus sp. JS10]|uniref:hypothetical protein n=1 Tax=Saccharibacillus sp. JS10 TaxID=2950552 RepID=UPI00210A17D5|nr:hypothetical protein [Saccharibacillus sp. JS10]MCQ4088631.1 hypothetical protein [Saccharibacillus sp. JS10]